MLYDLMNCKVRFNLYPHQAAHISSPSRTTREDFQNEVQKCTSEVSCKAWKTCISLDRALIKSKGKKCLNNNQELAKIHKSVEILIRQHGWAEIENFSYKLVCRRSWKSSTQYFSLWISIPNYFWTMNS